MKKLNSNIVHHLIHLCNTSRDENTTDDKIKIDNDKILQRREYKNILMHEQKLLKQAIIL